MTVKKSRMTRILIEGDRALLSRLCEEAEAGGEVEVVRQPEKSLVMTKARDSVSEQPFYLGEVLVTECTVSIRGAYGFGVLIGEDAERAYRLAVVDAAYHAGLPMTADWEALLVAEERNIRMRHRQEESGVLRTQVHFDTTEEYYGKR
ncbi:MAG: phnG [Paenibacillus sp.]|jgi:alpha-D-ribose 1-methylphosphonate 5-triphosphate synthase subunit PhnG|nr:phnG [Paenibacillus sp.]